MKTSKYLLSAAIAGIVAGTAASQAIAASTASDSDQKIKCYNTCTGKGACKTATHACKGQNGCEGEGKIVMMSADACTKSGGLTKKPRTPAYPMPPATPPTKTGA